MDGLNLVWVKLALGNLFFIYISVLGLLQILEWMCMAVFFFFFVMLAFWQKKNIKQCFCVLRMANTLTCFECFFYIQKILEVSKMCFRMDFLNTKKKLFSCISGFYNMFVKLQRVLTNIPKKYKNLILRGIHLLFTANVWIKKSLKDEYPKYYWE